jgi:hypothetical protein
MVPLLKEVPQELLRLPHEFGILQKVLRVEGGGFGATEFFEEREET